MASTNPPHSNRPGSLFESQKNYDPRIVSFYFVLGAMLLTLAGGLGYQQLSKGADHRDAERKQTQRRVLFPGPRGNIYDRNGQVLVENRHGFAVMLHLDELRSELRREQFTIRQNFVKAVSKEDLPTDLQFRDLARVSVAQRYLDQVNKIIGRTEKIRPEALHRHFGRRLMLPFTLVDDLSPIDYAQLIERLPVRSPLEVFASGFRSYPHGSAAAHTLGYVRPDDDIEAEDLSGKKLTTFKMPGSRGIDGLEKWFDAQLEGKTGGRIYRVDPAGYKIEPPLEVLHPRQGQHLTTSLDIELQLAAEEALGDQTGAAVALDVRTGEVLVMASKPDYDLNEFSPRATRQVVAEMDEKGAWVNLAMNGFKPPGSTFKILTSIAGLHRGIITPDQPIVNCNHWLAIGGRPFPCYNGKEAHHDVLLRDAIAESCDIYYYRLGLLLTPDVLAAETRRFRLDQRTGIELPNESGRMIVPDPAWMKRERGERWYDGETANFSIGQGALQFSPLQMACFIASVARGETTTTPTLVHQPDRPRQRTEPLGLSPGQYAALLDGMEGCVTHGTAKRLTQVAAYRVPATVVGKTGTAQITGNKNVAWFICFAPRENPEIAMAVAIYGDTPGEEYAGGEFAAPVASAVLQKYFAKKAVAATSQAPVRSE